MGSETIYISTVFFAGVLSFFSPCIIPILPVYFAMFSANGKSKGKSRVIVFLKSFLFVAGISVCFIVLGFGAGALGGLIGSKIFMMVMGAIVIILGLHQMGILKLKWLLYEKKVNVDYSPKNEYLSAFILGLTFSFGWTPCIGPVMGTILGLSATSGASWYGGFLMGIYSLGFLIPFLILAAFSDILLQKIKFIHRYLDKIKIAGGIIIIIMGILLMTGKLNILARIFQ